MINIHVSSDSNLDDLNIAKSIIVQLINRIELRGDAKLGVANVDKRWKPSVDEICEEFKVPAPTFNATELAEAEQLGKPACSTVDASQSTTAHADTTVNTSLPAPTSVFGQPAQTTENVANPAVHLTSDPVVDVDGLLWDKRIHSSSKELNKDGTWRKRRGVDDELVRSVEAELRGEHSAPVPQPKPPVDHSHEGETPVFTAIIPTEMTFTELLDGVTKAMVAGTLSQATIAAALDSVGLTALPHLLGNTALIPAFREALGGVV